VEIDIVCHFYYFYFSVSKIFRPLGLYLRYLTFFHKKLAVVFWKNGPKAIIFAAALEKAESMSQ